MEDVYECVLRVFFGNNRKKYVDVRVTKSTLCIDIIDFCCNSPLNIHTELIEVWQGCERVIGTDENISELLKRWGNEYTKVSFCLRNKPAMPVPHQEHGRRTRRNRNGLREESNQEVVVGGGVDLTLSELQEMASRQQRQIEEQHQMLVAKEQRLKFLKQQEVRHQQIATENERLRKVREKVESQELKLKRLRAIKGQVTDTKTTNNTLSGELETIKSMFNEKEKELSLAVNKVEELTRQLEEMRRGRMDGTLTSTTINNTALDELRKLRQEVVIRNKLNEQQTSKLEAHQDILYQREQEMTSMDKRIAELQQRLRAKKQMQQQQHQHNNRNHSNNTRVPGNNMIVQHQSPPPPPPPHPLPTSNVNNMNNNPVNTQSPTVWGSNNNNIATIEPYNRVNKHHRNHTEATNGSGAADSSVSLSKQDPKYQSLPYNVKFTDTNKENRGYGSKPSVTSTQSRSQVSTGGPVQHQPVNRALQKVADMTLASTVSSSSSSQHSGSRGASSEAHMSMQSSPSILYASGESPGDPMTSTPVNNGLPQQKFQSSKNAAATTEYQSTPVTTKQPIGSSNNNREIFITGAPASSSTKSSSNSQQLSPRQQQPALHGSESAVHYRDGSPRMRGGQQLSPAHDVTQHIRSSSNDSSSSTQLQHSREGSDDQNRGAGENIRSESTGALPRSTTPQQPISRQVISDSNIHSKVGSAPHSSSKPVRYASRDVIANTYASKRNAQAMDQYRKNITQYYSKDFSNKTASPNSSSGSPADDGNSAHSGSSTAVEGSSPTAAVKATVKKSVSSAAAGNSQKSVSAVSLLFPSPHSAPTIEVEQASESPDEAQTQYSGVYNIDPERSRFTKQSLNAPRPLRRRHSSGGDTSPDSKQKYAPSNKTSSDTAVTKTEEHSKTQQQLQQNQNEHQEKPTTEQASPSASSTPTTSSLLPLQPTTPPVSSQHPDIVNVSLTLNEGLDDSSDEEEKGEVQDNEDAGEKSTSLLVGSHEDIPFADETCDSPTQNVPVALRRKKGNLKSKDYVKSSRRVSFDPLALLLDAALEGELDLVMKSAHEVADPSCPNDEGITALHNAICAGHYDIVKFLVEYGCDVNSPDSDGWTPLHCAASCNNLGMVRLLVEHGACIFAETISDQETAAEKCEEDEEGYHGCSEYLYSIQEKLGIANKGEVFAVFDYDSAGPDELTFKTCDSLIILRKGDEQEKEWWWAKSTNKKSKQGYIPRNLLGMFPRITPKWLSKNEK